MFKSFCYRIVLGLEKAENWRNALKIHTGKRIYNTCNKELLNNYLNK